MPRECELAHNLAPGLTKMSNLNALSQKNAPLRG